MYRFSSVLCLFLVCLLGSFALAQTAQPCVSGVAANAIEGPVDGPPVGVPSCSAVTRKIACDKRGGYLYSFTVTNNTGEPVTSVLVTPPAGSGFSISPQTP